MAANLGQAFLGAGIVPTIAQELAAGNFHENRDSFHDYIYSKLILGEERGNTSSGPSPNPPVFPNTHLAGSYPNSLPVASSPGGQDFNNSSHRMMESGNEGIRVNDNKAFNVSLSTAANIHKSGSSKKKSSQVQQNTTQPVFPGNNDGLTKMKKKSHHKKKEKTNVCDVCRRAFTEKYTLNRHMMTHTHVKPYSCSKCNMSFSRTDGLAKHMAAGHRRIDAHHCDVCGGTFNSEVSFEQHRREYGNTLPFVCNLCMLAFSQCCHLNYHMKSHSLSKMNDSLISDSLNSKNDAVDVSELIPDDFSTPKKDGKDSFSGMFLGSAKLGNFLTERRTDHSVLDPSIVVKPEVEDYAVCQSNQIKASSTQASLANPAFEPLNNFPAVTSSTAASPAMNSQTSQSGNNLGSNTVVSGPSYLHDTSGSLSSPSSSETTPISEAEMKKYLDIKIPNPRFLESSVSQGGNDEDGLFRCEICRKGFTRKYHMQRHVKLHIRGPIPKAHLLDWTRRPYACGVCKMGFTRQHHLTRHMLIHTGERPHSCHMCGKAFRRFTNLTLHIRTVHGAERPFTCQICGRGFPRLYSLQRHLKLHAKNVGGLKSENVDQLFIGFQAVGTAVNHALSDKSSFYSTASIHSPDHSQESVSSDHSESSERYDHESSAHDDSMELIDPDGNNSPVTNQEGYALLKEDAYQSAGFHSHSDIGSNRKDRTVPPFSLQADDRLSQSRQLDSDVRAQNQQLVISNIDNVNRPNSNNPEASLECTPSPRPNNEPSRSHAQLQSRDSTKSVHPSSTQSTNNDRFMNTNVVSSQNMRTLDTSVGRNFSDMGITQGSNYMPNQQRGNSVDEFNVQQVPNSHSLMSSLERPGSRSMVNQVSGSDMYNPLPTGYVPSPSPLLTQQHGSVDLTVTRSPANIRDAGVYSQNRLVDISVAHSTGHDHSAYLHNHSLNSLSFPGNVTGIYQQQLNENVSHPNPSGSPMPTSSHNSNIQY